MAGARETRFGSFCSGIEAASKAFLPLGWTCGYVAEIEPFACAYLAQRYGATRPRYMPKPEDVAFPAGFDPWDAVLFRRLAAKVTADAKAGSADPVETNFVKAWRERADRRTNIATLDKISWGDNLLNLGDLSQVSAQELPRVDLAAAGYPCQDFSIAGLRASLDGARGNLSIIGTRLLLEAADLGLVRAALLEQVPDVLNTADNAWGNILGALVGADAALAGLDHGGKWPSAGMVAGPRSRLAWRVLDAQHFGLAQRRERVWTVVDFGDGPDPAAVLFERKGVLGHHQEGRSEDEDVAPTLAGGARKRGGFSYDDVPQVAAFGGNNTSGPIDVATARTASHTASGRQDFESETFVVSADVSPTLRAQHNSPHRLDAEAVVAHSLRGEGFDASEDGTGRGTPIVPVLLEGNAIAGTLGQRSADHPSGLKSESDFLVPVAYSIMPQNSGKDYKAREVDVAQPVMAAGPAGGNQGGDYIVQQAHCFDARQSDVLQYGQISGPLDTGIPPPAIAFSLRGREGGAMPEVEGGDVSPSLRAADGGSTRPFVAQPMAVRRITVVEAERLQGFSDNETLIDWPSANRKGEDMAETVAYLMGHGLREEDAQRLAQTPDGPRYKAIGNSWPVAVAHWIGRRIDAVWSASAQERAA